MKNFSILVLLSLSLFSCTRDATIDLPEVEPSLGLSCFISPGNPIEATLVEVSPIYGTRASFSPESVSNATVYFSDGIDTILLVFSQDKYHDPLNSMAIVPGRTYNIWAIASGYPEISASATVPTYSLPDFDVEFESFPNQGDTIYQVQCGWQDRAGEANYYRVLADLVDSANGGLLRSNTLLFWSNQNVSDEGRDGQILSNYPNEGSYYGSMDAETRYVHARVLIVDEHYFKYHNTLSNYDGENPFAEPVSLYSNVKGGSGILGCFRYHEKYVRIF